MIDLTGEDSHGDEHRADSVVLSDMEISDEEQDVRDVQSYSGPIECGLQCDNQELSMTVDNDNEQEPEVVASCSANTLGVSYEAKERNSHDRQEIASPALSYLSLDDQYTQDRRASEILPAASNSLSSVASQRKRRWSTSDSDSSSSDDGDAEEEGRNDDTRGSFLRPSRAASVNEDSSLAMRLLNGTTSAENILAEASDDYRRRVLDFMVQTMTSPEGRTLNRRDHAATQIGTRQRPSEPKNQRSERDRPHAPKLPSSRVNSSGSQSSVAETDEGHRVVLPRAPLAKGRRLLIPSHPEVPITAVYMRGDVQFIDPASRYVFVDLRVE